ncbi:YncE family protein [Pyxidicoccus sp. 3LFB2]
MLVSVLLCACGGGGGGHADPSLSVSTGSLRFEAEESGATPSAGTLTVRINDPGEALPHVEVAASSHGLSQVTYDTSTNPFTVRVMPKAPAEVEGRTVTDQLVISACLDVACTRHIPGSPTTVDVTYTVRGHLQVVPETLAFSRVLGSSEPPSGTTLSLRGRSVPWEASASPSWLQLTGSPRGTTPASLGVVISTTGLAAGSHSGTITLTDTDRDESITVPVTLQLTAPSLAVSPGTLSFTGVEGTSSPAQPLVLSLDTGSAAHGWTATVSTGSGPQWLELSSSAGTVSASGTTLSVSVDSTGLPNGTHSAIINFTATVAEQTVTQSVPVSLSVQNRLVVTPEALSFDHVLGSSTRPGSAALSLQGTGVHWSVSASPGWIQLSGAASGVTPASLSVGVNPAGLPVGTHEGDITLTNTDTGEVTTVPVALRVVAPSLSTSPGSLSFSSSDMESPPAKSLSLSLETGTATHGWTATLDTGGGAQWLKLSSTSGTVSASGTTLSVSVDSTGLQGGTYSASIVFTATVEGQRVSRTVPVSLAIHGYLWVADNGVGLVSTPSVSKLSHTVTVKDSLGQPLSSWEARSSHAWLSVTGGGTSGELTLTANPASLTDNTLHLAEVSIAHGDTPDQVSEVVKVGLWVGTAVTNGQDTLPIAYRVVETDPIRPHAYVHNGAGSLFVYNLYTAGLVATLTNLGSSLGAMTVSSDGSTLYVLDATAQRIIPVDLGTLTAGTPWPVSSSSQGWLTYTRPQGHGLVLTHGGQIFEPTTGAVVTLVTGRMPSGMAELSASQDGSLFCGINTGISPYTMSCSALQYTSRTGAVTITARGSGPFGVGSNGRDVAVNHDGSRVYAASGAPYSFTVYDGQTLSVLTQLPADAYPNAVEVGPDNRLYGAASVWYGPRDVWVYDNAGLPLGSYDLSGYARNILERQLKVSGDGKRFVVLTDDPRLVFVTAP